MRAVDPRTGRLYRVVESARPSKSAPSFRSPPKALRAARLDNLAIVPASLLPHKAEWQALANTLPEGSTLIVLPHTPGAARDALERVSIDLSAHGSRVTTVEHDGHQLRTTPWEATAP